MKKSIGAAILLMALAGTGVATGNEAAADVSQEMVENRTTFEERRFHNSSGAAKRESKEYRENTKAMKKREARKEKLQNEGDDARDAGEARKAEGEKRLKNPKKKPVIL